MSQKKHFKTGCDIQRRRRRRRRRGVRQHNVWDIMYR